LDFLNDLESLFIFFTKEEAVFESFLDLDLVALAFFLRDEIFRCKLFLVKERDLNLEILLLLTFPTAQRDFDFDSAIYYIYIKKNYS